MSGRTLIDLYKDCTRSASSFICS